MKNKSCVQHLEYLARHGLDLRILVEYRNCGMLYFSKFNPINNNSTVDRFVDFAGIDRDIIRIVDELETNLNISPYHIVIDDSGLEIIVLYVDNKLDLDYQLEVFKKGQANGIAIYPEQHRWLYKDVQYDVVLGGVVDKDFKLK